MDVAIRYGDGAWPGMEARFLASARLVVAGAPSLVESGPTTADLAGTAWILSPDWPEQDDYLRCLGLDPRALSRTDIRDEDLSIAAARQGMGLVMESVALAESAVDEGALVLVHDSRDHLLACIIVTPSGPQRRAVRQFLAWLAEAASGLASLLDHQVFGPLACLQRRFKPARLATATGPSVMGIGGVGIFRRGGRALAHRGSRPRQFGQRIAQCAGLVFQLGHRFFLLAVLERRNCLCHLGLKIPQFLLRQRVEIHVHGHVLFVFQTAGIGRIDLQIKTAVTSGCVWPRSAATYAGASKAGARFLKRCARTFHRPAGCAPI